jgi:DNA polymerase-3 subunit delta'
VSELTVLGHDRALETMRAVAGSSLLLVGPEGVGRRRAARWLAASLNCQAEPGERPCGGCDSCRRFAAGHPDYREISARETTGTGRLSPRPEIRIGQLVPRPGEEEPLSIWLEQRPAYRRRVGVIDGADRLTAAAANSFLKILEEPPSYATIVLIAPSPRAVLPTVASRCAVVRFGAVDTSGMGVPGHPAHRLGRPGPLLSPAADLEEARAEVDSFRLAVEGSLEEALAAADALAARWQQAGGNDLAELLRERFRDLEPEARLRSDDLVLAAEEAIAGYSPATLALRVLMLELRRVLS